MLPYDQIPPGRRATGDAFSRLDEHGAVLMIAIAQWMTRDDSRAEPEVTRAGNTAMDEIDAMLAGLHALRSRLAGEIREHHDIGNARADALLARLRDAPRKDMRASALAQLMTGRHSAQAPADAEAWAFE
ncbi:MAG: hypothetical protein ACRDOL_21050 [Streptosporangiaceae bacterium]